MEAEHELESLATPVPLPQPVNSTPKTIDLLSSSLDTRPPHDDRPDLHPDIFPHSWTGWNFV